MEFFDQFSNRPEPLLWPGYPDDLFTPVDGFTGEHVESITHLVRRLEAGEFVGELDDGLTSEDQVFTSEYVDRFDLLDFASQSGIDPHTPQNRPAVPDSDIAPTEGPSPNSVGDNVGNQETA